MTVRTFAFQAFASLLTLGTAGCSAAGDTNPVSGEGGSGGTGAGGTGTGGIILQGGGGGVGGGTRDPNDMRDLPTRKRTCDANGQNCTCLRLALLGTLDSAADETDTTPFVNWLNDNSGGTATVTMVTTKPTLDGAFLTNYDILVVANVNTWTFSADEKSAVRTWMLESGGGIITLTGFVSTAAEPAATSQLLEPAGFSYSSAATAPSSGETMPVYYEGGTENLKRCLWWSGNRQAGITTPIKFTPQTGGMEKLTFELDYVGAFIGWAVAPPAGATTVATDPVTGQPMASAFELEGKGRVFAFGDEWVIFANQWEPVGTPDNSQPDMYNSCWIAPDGTNPASFHSVATLYQTKQFWYNAVNWVAPPNECNFIIDDPDVVVR
jgi:hypothetical protein